MSRRLQLRVFACVLIAAVILLTHAVAWNTPGHMLSGAITYQNGAIPGTPRGDRRDCRKIVDANVLPTGHTRTAGRIAHRRIMLAGWRLADLLERF